MDDIFRKETRTLSKAEQDHLNVIKQQAEVLLEVPSPMEGWHVPPVERVPDEIRPTGRL